MDVRADRDEVNQKESELVEVDGMKQESDSKGKL